MQQQLPKVVQVMAASFANLNTAPRPKWLDKAQHEIDLSDIWIECMDPENERNEVCTGHFRDTDFDRRILGVVIEHEHGFTSTYDRDELIALWGEFTVARVERACTPDQMGDEFPNGRFLS